MGRIRRPRAGAGRLFPQKLYHLRRVRERSCARARARGLISRARNAGPRQRYFPHHARRVLGRKSAPRSSVCGKSPIAGELPAAEFVVELQKRVPDAVWKHSTRIIRRDRSRNGSMRDAERAALATDKSGQVSRVIYREKRDGISRRPRFTSPYSALPSRRGLT